jgi:hypothetical protein
MLFATIAALAIAGTDCGVSGARSIVDFDVMQPPAEPINLPQGLSLTFENGYDDGYSVVARSKPSDYNLLDWRNHGPDPSDLLAWSHLQKYYPDVRRLRVRHHHAEIVLDLRDVRSVADPEADELAGAKGIQLAGPSGKFTGGTVHLCWLSERALLRRRPFLTN